MAKKVVLAGACRTAIGKMGGALSNTPAADLGAIVIKEALNRAGVKPEQVDEVMMGCVIQAAQGPVSYTHLLNQRLGCCLMLRPFFRLLYGMRQLKLLSLPFSRLLIHFWY